MDAFFNAVGIFAVLLWLPLLVAAVAAVYTYRTTKSMAVALLFGAYAVFFGLQTWRAPIRERSDGSVSVFDQLTLNWMFLFVAIFAAVLIQYMMQAKKVPPPPDSE